MRQIPKGLELAPRQLTKARYGKKWRERSGNRQRRSFTSSNWPMGLVDHTQRQIHQVLGTLRSCLSNWMTKRCMSKIWSQPETKSCKWRRTPSKTTSTSSLHRSEIIAKQLKHLICTTTRATPAKTKPMAPTQKQMSHQDPSGRSSRRSLKDSINMSSFKTRWGWHTRSRCLLGWTKLQTILSNRANLTCPRMRTSQATICNHSLLQMVARLKKTICLQLLVNTPMNNSGARSWMAPPQTSRISKRPNKSLSPISFIKTK